ncbi:hypothetical protein ACFE04_005514 [Oxalis oulophora]
MSRSSSSPPPNVVITDGVSSPSQLLKEEEDGTVYGVQLMEAHQSPNVKKRKELITEMMDLDNYEDQPQQAVVIDETGDTKNKGKEIYHQSNDFGHYLPQASLTSKKKMDNLSLYSSDQADELFSKYELDNGFAYSDSWFEDPAYGPEQFEMLQACVDGMDFPSGVEEDIPWYPALVKMKEKKVEENQQKVDMLQASIVKMDFPSSVEADVSLFPEFAQSGEEKKLGEEASSLDLGAVFKNEFVFDPHVFNVTKSKMKVIGSNSLVNDVSKKASKLKKIMAATKSFEHTYHFTGHHQLEIFPSDLTNFFGDAHTQSEKTWFGSAIEQSSFPLGNMQNASQDEIIDLTEDTFNQSSIDGLEMTEDTFNQSSIDGLEIWRKFQLFKQFDTAEDHSDHHYNSMDSSKQQPKQWAKTIQEEWKILEKNLPDTIFVRVYESRMDILRAAIIGAEGTPYHDGLFFFDIFFPEAYPNVPPHFEDFVFGHFHDRAHAILSACKAYYEGLLVGCPVKGGVQDVDERGRPFSHRFKDSLKGIIKLLVSGFTKIGVKDCDKFLIPEAKPLAESCELDATYNAAIPAGLLD